MADVFVSYARPDEPQSERVAGALRAAGYRVRFQKLMADAKKRLGIADAAPAAGNELENS